MRIVLDSRLSNPYQFCIMNPYWIVGIDSKREKCGLQFLLLFYCNQILGVSATLTAIALAVAVLFDAVSDPIAGSASDRFQ